MADLHGEVSRGGKFYSKLTDQRGLPTELQGKKEFSRNEVIGAFDSAFAGMESGVKNLLAGNPALNQVFDKWQRGDSLTADENNALKSLTADQRKRLSDYKTVLSGKKLTDVKNGRDTFKHEVKKADGSVIEIQEGIPVDGLLDYLHDEVTRVRQEIDSINNGTLAVQDKNAAIADRQRTLKELIREGYTLYHNSADSSDKIEKGHPALDGTQAFFRAQTEAYYISQDPLRDTGDGVNNFYAGINTIRRRRNLNFAGTNAPTPPVQPPPPNTQTSNPNQAPPPPITPNVPPNPNANPNAAPNTTVAATNVNNQPRPVTIDDLNYEFGVANRSIDIRKRAVEMAEQQVREEQRRGRWLDPRAWIRKIKMRVFEEYYRQLYIKRAVEAMQRSGNAYMKMDLVNNAVIDANFKIAEEKSAGKSKLEQVKTMIRERIGIEGQQVLEAQGPLRDLMMTELVRPLFNDLDAGRPVSEADMQQRLRDFVQRNENNPDPTVRQRLAELYGKDATKYGKLADYFATDMLDMVQKMVSDKRAHGFAVNQLEDKVKIILANTSWAAESEANFNNVDRFIAWSQKSKIGVFVGNPMLVGAFASAISYFGLRLPGGLLKRAAPIASPLIGGAVGGLFAAGKRNMDLKRDIAAHRVERAYGALAVTKEQIDAQIGNDRMRRVMARLSGAYRRADLEEFAYNTASLRELTEGGGQDIVRGHARKSINELLQDVNNPENKADLISRVAELRTRLDYSSQNKVDLISFEGRELVEQNRLTIIREIARAKMALRLAGVTDAEIAAQEQAWQSQFSSDKTDKDRSFNIYKAKQMAGAFTLGFTSGMAGGIIGQEAMAGLARSTGFVVRDTFLGAVGTAVREASGQPAIPTPHLETIQEAFAGGGTFPLGKNFEFNVDPADHSIDILDSQTHLQIPNMPKMELQPDGQIHVEGKLPPDVFKEFDQANFDINAGPMQTETLIGDTLNSRIETIIISGKQIKTWVPQGELPDHTLWKGQWVDNKDGTFDLIAVKDSGPDAGQPVKFMDGRDVLLVDNAKFNDKGEWLGGTMVNGTQLDKALTIEIGKVPGGSAQWFKDLVSTGHGKIAGYDFSLSGKYLKIIDSAGDEVAQNQIVFDTTTNTIKYEAVQGNAIPAKLVNALKASGLIQNESDLNKAVRLVGAPAEGRIPQPAGSVKFTDNVDWVAEGGWAKPLGKVHGFDSGEAVNLAFSTDPVNGWKPFPMTEVINGQRVFSMAHFFEWWEDAKIIDATHVQISGGVHNGEVIEINPQPGLDPATSQKWLTDNIGKRILFDRLNRDVSQAPEGLLNDVRAIKEAIKPGGGKWYDTLGDLTKRFGIGTRFDPTSTQAQMLSFDKGAFATPPAGFANRMILNDQGDLGAWTHFVWTEKSGDFSGQMFSVGNSGPTEMFEMKVTPPEGLEPIFGQEQRFIFPEGITQEVPTQMLVPPNAIDIPFIPMPLMGRHPLGPLEYIFPPEIPPPMYYGGENLHNLQEWLRANPNRHHQYNRIARPDGTTMWLDREGNPVRRDVTRERNVLNNYINELRSKDQNYVTNLESLASSAKMTPMTNECRVSINIPAWMEGKNMYRVLSDYVKQTDENGNRLDPNTFEINIIVNRKTGSTPDNSVAEIERFIAESRARGENYRVNYIDLEFNPPLNNVGHARKVLTDLTLLRSLRRTGQTQALYVESEDADLVQIDPKTVINIVKKMDENANLDAVRGIQDRYPETMMKNDLLFLQRRIWDFTELFLRRKKFRPENNPNWNFTWNRIITGGWNTAYSAEAYALIGGYDSRQTKGEDMTIGEKITMVRGDGSMPNLDVVGRVPTRSDSSPRRFIGELITGKGAYTDTFEDERVNNFIKNATLDELLHSVDSVSRISDVNKGSFSGMFEGHYKSIKNLTLNETEAKEFMDSILMWIGFRKTDYNYTADGGLNITNWDNLKASLDDYRNRHQNSRNPGERTKYKTSP